MCLTCLYKNNLVLAFFSVLEILLSLTRGSTLIPAFKNGLYSNTKICVDSAQEKLEILYGALLCIAQATYPYFMIFIINNIVFLMMLYTVKQFLIYISLIESQILSFFM